VTLSLIGRSRVIKKFSSRSQSKTSWPPMCYSNHHTDKPHHLPSQSRLFQPEGKLICTCPLQGIQPTAQLASTVQIKQKCFLNSAWRNQGVQQASEHPGSFKSTMVGLHWLFFFFVCLLNFGCSWTTWNHAWVGKPKLFGRVKKYISSMRKQYK